MRIFLITFALMIVLSTILVAQPSLTEQERERILVLQLDTVVRELQQLQDPTTRDPAKLLTLNQRIAENLAFLSHPVVRDLWASANGLSSIDAQARVIRFNSETRELVLQGSSGAALSVRLSDFQGGQITIDGMQTVAGTRFFIGQSNGAIEGDRLVDRYTYRVQNARVENINDRIILIGESTASAHGWEIAALARERNELAFGIEPMPDGRVMLVGTGVIRDHLLESTLSRGILFRQGEVTLARDGNVVFGPQLDTGLIIEYDNGREVSRFNFRTGQNTVTLLASYNPRQTLCEGCIGRIVHGDGLGYVFRTAPGTTYHSRFDGFLQIWGETVVSPEGNTASRERVVGLVLDTSEATANTEIVQPQTVVTRPTLVPIAELREGQGVIWSRSHYIETRTGVRLIGELSNTELRRIPTGARVYAPDSDPALFPTYTNFYAYRRTSQTLDRARR